MRFKEQAPQSWDRVDRDIRDGSQAKAAGVGAVGSQDVRESSHRGVGV